MADYLVSGRGPDGRQVTERVEAGSAAEAVRLLEQRNFTDIVLHTSDVEVLVRQKSEAVHGKKDVHRVFTPREQLQLRRDGTYLGVVLLMIRVVFARSWWVVILGLALLEARRYFGRPPGFMDNALIAALLLPLAWAVVAPLFGSARRYRRVIEARAWGRWEEVLALLPTIEGKVPAHHSEFYRAMALAGLGKLDEALRRYERFGDGKRIPLWLYWSHRSSVCAAGNDIEGGMRAVEKAAELAPAEPAVLIDYATSLVRRRRDARRARQVLDEALKHPVSDLIDYGVDLCRGMIALEENQPYEARECLNRAMDKVMSFRNANPLMGSARDRVHAFLALANAATGDHEAALRHYRIAEPRLVALRCDDLIERCEAALGLTASRPNPGGP
jgi:tetratricopeptide (TPR) repeat protein